MKKNLKGRIGLIAAVLLICLYGIFGIPSGLSGKSIVEALTNRIHLGLDLKGGAHLILQVQVKEAVNAETDNTVTRLQQDLKKANLAFNSARKPDPNKPTVVTVDGTAPTASSSVRSLLDTKYGNEYDISNANGTWTLTMKPNVQQDLERRTVSQAIETIRDRVDTLGVSEPVIQEYNLGANQILVELPGISDLDRVKGIIQSTARLEIHPVAGGPFPSEQAALQSVGGTLPPEDMILPSSGTIGGQSGDQYYVLQRLAVVAGSEFRSADPSVNPDTGQRMVRFTLTNDAGEKFYEYTKANVGNPMAVVMGGTVREVANIKSPIHDQGEIEGSFNEDEVTALSKLLRTGALPASLSEIETRTVGASLGADSIKEGVTAAIVGMICVMAFMLVYYKGSGINADLALILNLLILLGFMGGVGATLTLPGIAGVILTIGMGVDSNVLIFERIREEIRAGKAASAAVDQGFAHAWITIVDTHVTTIVSAAILFLFGTGPVKGFATTLTFGLLANLFTAVFVSRTIFDAHLNKMKAGEMVSI
ncbi:protein translocase subunit SecD [Occallatibacter riparius]|uniref:Protein translocase subunit SecD n=1 Tax=Occallatibacter riparius TaxID=1002689 RepID=A0A9J7BU87_9BACT|nr:protein translocase subunit SecD [Occallatibacter riparius]UWZ86223.1 protein translocase subunit SecD [Occallatibacter riparius]